MMQLSSQPWLIDSRALADLLARADRAVAVSSDDERVAEARVRTAISLGGDIYDPNEPCPAQRVGNGAVLAIAGTLYHGSSWLMNVLGGVSIQLVAARVRALKDDASVRWVVLDVNSPGSTVAGIVELADAVRELSARKPVVACAHDLMASGAYWIAAACNEICAAATAMVGSVGVVMAIDDTSAMYDKAGIKRHVLRSGELKCVGIDGATVTDAQLASIAPQVNSSAEMFFAHVAERRKLSVSVVRGWQGAIFTAADALKNNVIDAVEPFEKTVRRAQETYGGAGTVVVNFNPVENLSDAAPSQDDESDDAYAATPQRLHMDWKTITAKDVAEQRPDIVNTLVKALANSEPAASFLELKAALGEDAVSICACLEKSMSVNAAKSYQVNLKLAAATALAESLAAQRDESLAKLASVEKAEAALKAENATLKTSARGVKVGTITHAGPSATSEHETENSQPAEYLDLVRAKAAAIVEKTGEKRGTALAQAHRDVPREHARVYAAYRAEQNQALIGR